MPFECAVAAFCLEDGVAFNLPLLHGVYISSGEVVVVVFVDEDKQVGCGKLSEFFSGAGGVDLVSEYRELFKLDADAVNFKLRSVGKDIILRSGSEIKSGVVDGDPKPIPINSSIFC